MFRNRSISARFGSSRLRLSV